jgi:hypothetical protein
MTEYAFPVPGAARLASLAGLKSDLEQVVEYCDRMIERYAGAHLKKSPFDIVGFTTHIDFIDWEALSTAACVSYARCFVSGVRQSLNADLLVTAEAELRDTHDFILNLRNKHVAHSVNSFEENSVTVHVEDSFHSSSEIRSAVPRHNRAVGLPFDAPAKLKQLAAWWLNKVTDEISIELAKVISLAQSMPLDEIRAFGVLKSSMSDERRSNVGKRRSQT